MQALPLLDRGMFARWLAVLGGLLGTGGVAAQCLPAELNGGGTPAVVELNAAGAAVGWWCPDRFRPRLTLYAVRWEALTPALHAELNALWRAADKRAAIERIRAEHADTPLGNPRLAEVWRPARERILALKPPTPTWVVPVNGPAYRLVGGNITAQPGVVRAGTLCDCARDETRVTVGGTVYCPAAHAPLAVCVPKTP